MVDPNGVDGDQNEDRRIPAPGSVADLLNQVVNQPPPPPEQEIPEFPLSLPLTSMHHGVIAMREIPHVPNLFEVITYSHEYRAYVLRTVPNHGTLTFDGVLNLLLAEVDSDMDHAKTFLRDPGTVRGHDVLVDPDACGFPYSRLCDYFSTNDNLIKTMGSFFVKVDSTRQTYRSNVFEKRTVTLARETLVNYSKYCMDYQISVLNRTIATQNTISGRIMQLPRAISHNEFILPNTPYDIISSPFDDLSNAPEVRVEVLSYLAAIHIQPQRPSSNTVLRVTNSSSTRASLVSNILAMTLHSSYGPAIRAYINSLISPGDILLDIDVDMPDDLELAGFYSLLVRPMLMSNASSGYTNVTARTASDNTLHITRWMDGRSGTKAMSELDVNTTFAFMDKFVDTDAPADKDPMREFYKTCHKRRNYFVDTTSEMAAPLISDMARNNPWLKKYARETGLHSQYGALPTYISTRISELSHFFAKLNHILRTSWYSNMRRSQDNFLRSDPTKEATVVPVPIKALVFLMCNVGLTTLSTTYDYMRQYRMECGLGYDIMYANAKLNMLQSLINAEGFTSFFSTSELILKSLNHSEFLRFIYIKERDVANESTMPDTILKPPPKNALDPFFSVLTEVNDARLMSMGIMRQVVVAPKGTGITQETIKAHISEQTIYRNTLNAIEDSPILTPEAVLHMVNNRGFQFYMRYLQNPRIVRGFFPYKIEKKLDSCNQTVPIASIDTVVSSRNAVSAIAYRPVAAYGVFFRNDEYTYDDDYVKHGIDDERTWILPDIHETIFVSAELFVSQMAQHANYATFLSKGDFKFVDMYTLFD